MKKLFTILASGLLILNGANVSAHSGAFEEGQNSVSIGYGFGTVVGALASAYKNETGYAFSGTGPIYLKYEHAITDGVGLGLNIAYAKYKFAWAFDTEDANFQPITYAEGWELTTMSFLARINWHFGDSEKFDPYFGVGLGYRTGSWKWTTTDPSGTQGLSAANVVPFGFETTVGARYLFTDNIGAYAELGIAKSVLQVGLNFKF